MLWNPVNLWWQIGGNIIFEIRIRPLTSETEHFCCVLCLPFTLKAPCTSWANSAVASCKTNRHSSQHQTEVCQVWIPGTNKFLPFLDIFSMKLLSEASISWGPQVWFIPQSFRSQWHIYRGGPRHLSDDPVEQRVALWKNHERSTVQTKQVHSILQFFESKRYRSGQSGSWDKLFGQVLKRQAMTSYDKFDSTGYQYLPVLCSIYRAQRMPGAEISFAMRPRFRSSREQNKSTKRDWHTVTVKRHGFRMFKTWEKPWSLLEALESLKESKR
jgi:hypothetical protein